MVVPVAVAVVEAGVVVVAAVVLGVVIGLGEGGREVLARGHRRAEALCMVRGAATGVSVTRCARSISRGRGPNL